MKIRMDSTNYGLNLTNVSKFLQQWYEANKHKLDRIETDGGKIINFDRKSILRIGFKTAFMPIGLPALKMAYKMRGAELPPHVKHEDFIDYFMFHAFGLIALYDDGSLYATSIESPDGHSRDIDDVSTHEPLFIAAHAESTGEENTTEEGSGTRGQALLRSGQNGYGQDETNQGDNTEEDFNPTRIKRIPPRHQEEG